MIAVETNRIKTNLADVAIALEVVEQRLKESAAGQSPFSAIAEIPAAPSKAVEANKRVQEMAAGKRFRDNTGIARRAEEILRRHINQVSASSLGKKIESYAPYGDDRVPEAAQDFLRLIRQKIFGEKP